MIILKIQFLQIKKSFLVDKDKNKIFLENFEYNKNDNIFKSIGYIKIEDKLDNTYEFSQIYSDTQKNEILGTDIKTYLNDERFKINPKINLEFSQILFK